MWPKWLTLEFSNSQFSAVLDFPETRELYMQDCIYSLLLILGRTVARTSTAGKNEESSETLQDFCRTSSLPAKSHFR
jgi:hypothetical protein